MKHTPRLYYCVLCHAQAVICSYCDRGQIYCSKECAIAARAQSCREAEKRYQLSFKGKVKHALRQKRYRMRQKEKVTDHSSNVLVQDGLLETVKNKPVETAMSKDFGNKQCCFCKKPVLQWFRSGFLRYSSPLFSLKQAYFRPPYT